MEAFALYLFRSVVWLTGFALVYLLFLRNERYFLLNRVYLLAGTMASIVFPFFTWHYTVLIPFTPTVEVSELQMTGVVMEPEAFPTKEILLILYMAGALYLLYRITRQTVKVIGVIRQSEILPYRSAKLIRTPKYPASFSFFSFVFVNPSSSETETREIVNHELEHVRQRHWIDLVLFELLCTLQWFNPLCWLYGRFIRQNHEFLADQHALQRSANPAVYRAALINQLFGGEVISLANSFSYSINKKRFHMMKNTINPPIRKLKLLLILPIMAGVFYAFATPEYRYVQVDLNVTQSTEKTITGKVTDDKGNLLKGAAIINSEKKFGTITDNNGVFILKITDESPIVVSHVGYVSQKLSPDTEKVMVITLKRVNIGVDEVTVTGAYQGNSGQAPIGSTDAPVNKELDELTITGAYQGNSVPASLGSPIKLQTNSPLKFGNVDGQAQPIIIMDGVITEYANMNNISPETIESINVYKNEQAISKYGDKGKNGVIEIYTKKGASGSQNNLIDVNLSGDAHAQKDSKVFTMVEQMPEFPGGDIALRKFIAYSIKYPKTAVDNGIQGKVFVIFVVDKTGKVSEARIVRGVDPSLDKEALRVVQSMPQWKPGKQGGEDVSVEYTIPINFVLEKAQTDAASVKDNNEAFIEVEQMPEFPGGDVALIKFIAANVKYPAVAAEKGIQGKVYITFVVTKTGKVTDAKVARGVDNSLDQEAIRVVNLLPTWTPGKQKGVNVDVQYTVPINFVLEKDQTGATDSKNNNTPFTIVEEMPEFPGGPQALRAYIASNVKYPVIALENGIHGKVYVSFVVGKTGNIPSAKIVRGVDPSLDKEALRVINSMPKWTPGKQNGEAVDVEYTIPIEFSLPKDYKKTMGEKLKTPYDASKADNQQMGKLLIVPNPTQSKATVTLEGSDYSGKLEVSLFDSYGKLLKKESKNGPSFTLAVNSLTPGNYLVVTSDGSKQYQGHLVVSK